MKRNSNENNLGLEEEKKESSPRREAGTDPKLELLDDGPPTELIKTVCKDETIGQPGFEVEGLEDLVPLVLRKKKFKDEGELWKAQELEDLTDLDIVLDSEGNAVWRDMKSPYHDAAVFAISDQFSDWYRSQPRGTVPVMRFNGEASVYVLKSFERKKTRLPDLAIWGPDRLGPQGSVQVKKGKLMNPHVIFQFSWKNDLVKEKFAVDDMSLYAGMGEYEPLGRPKVIYLIKAIRSDEDDAFEFNVYEVRPDLRVAQIQPVTFVAGVDGTITVSPCDMGLEAGANSFTLELSAIRLQLELVRETDLEDDFIAENEDE